MKNLDDYRREIGAIDSEILGLFAKRFSVVQKIGKYKKQHEMQIEDKEREKTLITSLLLQARKYKISNEFITSVWSAIFKESYKIEK